MVYTDLENMASSEGDVTERSLLLVSSETSIRRRKRLTFAAFALIYFVISASFSVIAPFFPTEALAKGANENVVGFIFGIFALVTFIISPIIGKLIPTVGVRFLLFVGLFVIGVSEFLFGFLMQMPDGATFIVYALILRSFDGAGGAVAMTAAVVILAHCFPNNVASVMGGLELFTGLGLTLGPLIGGILYQYGGFELPFFVLAGVILIMLPITICILPPIKQEIPKNVGPTGNATITKLLKIPAFVLVVSTVMSGGIGIGIIEPLLAPHLKSEYNVTSSTEIGLIFLLFCGTYALFAPPFGWLADKTNPRWVMSFGCFFCGIGFLLLGPVPVGFLPKKVWFVTFSMGLIGMALGPCFVPTIAEMGNIVRAKGYPDNIATQGIVAGIFGAAYNIGSFIGPTLSGVIAQYVHFSWTCTGFGILLFIQSLALLALAISGNSRVRKTIVFENPSVESPSEQTPLILDKNKSTVIQTC